MLAPSQLLKHEPVAQTPPGAVQVHWIAAPDPLELRPPTSADDVSSRFILFTSTKMPGAVFGVTLGLCWFAAGILVGSTVYPVRHSAPVEAAKSLLLGPPHAHCADIYAGWPLSPGYRADELQAGDIPIPGLTHITLQGRRQHGLRGLELWLQTIAPGAGTPIHHHACEEVFYVLKGSAVMAIQGKDGAIVETPLTPNSTIAVLPNARHQIRVPADATEEFQTLVAIDSPPFQPVMFESWSDPDSAGHKVEKMLWDQVCPSSVPKSLAHLVKGAGAAAAGGSAEL